MATTPGGDRVSAVEIGPEIRVGIYVEDAAAHRLLTVGSAPDTLHAPEFDLTPAYESALSIAERHAGSFAFPSPPYGEDVRARAPRVAAVTGPGLAAGPTGFLAGNLVARDLEVLEELLDGVGFTILGRATTSVRAFRDRVDGPAAIGVIAAQTPDAVIVALGDDDTGEGLDYITDLLVGGLAGRESGYLPAIVLLYAGTPDARAIAQLEQAFPLHHRRLRGGTPNEPMDTGAPRSVLNDVARSIRARLFAGRGVPADIGRAPMSPIADALETATRRLASSQQLDTAVVALEHGHVTAVASQGGVTTLAHFGGAQRAGRTFHVGLHTPIDRVGRWAIDEPLPQALREIVLNRTARPWAVPGTAVELQSQHAMWTVAVREALRQGAEGRNPLEDATLDLAVLTGLGARTVGRPMQASVLLINALELWGVTQLALDAPSALGMTGALIDAGVHVAVESSLTPLGVCVAPRGQAKPGDQAVVVEVHPRDSAAIEREVGAGALDVVQWAPGVPAEVRIWPGPKFDVGLGYGRPAQLSAPVLPGVAGLVIDARGRPLTWPDDADERRAHVQHWYRALNVYPTDSPARAEPARAR